MKNSHFILIILILTGCNGGIEKNLNRAYTAEENKDFQLAIQYLDKVLKIKPNHLIALNNRGWNKLDFGDTIGALNDFNAMILSDTTCGRGFYNRGMVFYEQEKYSEALLNFDNALKIQGIFETDSNYNIPFLKLELTDNQFFGIRANDKSQKPETKLEWLFFKKGCTNYQLNNYQSAYKNFSYCIGINNDFAADAYYWRAFVFYKTGNDELACKDLIKAAGMGYSVSDKEYDMICSK